MTTTDDLIERLSKSCKVADACPECLLDRQQAAAELTRLQGRVAALEAEKAKLKGSLRQANGVRDVFASAVVALEAEYRKVEVLWKKASIDASRKHDTIGGLENACRISLARADTLQAENKLLRECARIPDLERIDAAIAALEEDK